MTKDLMFDLEFFTEDSETWVGYLTDRGRSFLESGAEVYTIKAIYLLAVERGLHVRFADKQTRDELSTV